MFIKSEDEFAKDFFADWLMVKSYLSFNKEGELADSLTDEVLISFVGLNSFDGKAGALLQGAIEKGLKMQLTDVSLISVDPELEMNLKKKLPRVFVALGEDAKNFFVSSGALTETQGKWLTWEGIKVMPTIHPEYVVTSLDAKKGILGRSKIGDVRAEVMSRDERLESLLSYELPEEKIAQRPVSYSATRSSSKLLHAQSSDENLNISEYKFEQVVELLKEGDLLVLNNSKVIHARFFMELPGLKYAEVLLVRPLFEANEWECLGRPLKKLENLGTFNLSKRLRCTVLDRINEGRGLRIKLEVLDGSELSEVIRDDGFAPIPPYIRSGKSDASDKDLYQTVYAKEEGSVAAPTAGLHFTEEILSELKSKGVDSAKVTLHVGPYSFFPVADKIEESQVLTERFLVPRETYDAIKLAKAEGRRVIAVGTTVVRCLETFYGLGKIDEEVGKWQESSLMIMPGFSFKVIDSMFTNFHQPRSTHLLLVGAFLGVDNMHKVYQYALSNNFRFLSYGDSSFLEKL